MASPLEADYVVVGGGLTGCALASRLSHCRPSSSILILEAGPNPSLEHDVVTPMGGFALQGSTLDWQYSTAATPTNAGRKHVLTAGKTLGGGSVLNYGGWSRGDKADYDAWANFVDGDQRWTYSGLLPYLRRPERFYDISVDPEQHGFEGPMRITSVVASDPKRKYPLRNPIQQGWAELGVKPVQNLCAGANSGIADYLENWDDGKRQPSHRAYPLNRVEIHPSTPVSEILFDNSRPKPKAIGVRLEDGRTVRARKEVIMSAGTLRTPIILQASGLGPASLLASRSIPLVHDLPTVGTYFDHFALFQLFKLKQHPTGLSLGAKDLTDPALFKGLPGDWVVNDGPPREVLEAALDEDGVTDMAERSAILAPGRSFVEMVVYYHPLAPGIPADGSWIATSVMLTLPSSRGKISLSAEHTGRTGNLPNIEPNYFSTALDRVCLVHGVRRMLKLLLGSEAMAPYVESEVPPPGTGDALTPDSTDAEIEARIRTAGSPHFHAMGSVPLGSALDTDLHVRGVDGLRVCDASVLPAPVGGHPQATLYGLAELTAEMIAQYDSLPLSG